MDTIISFFSTSISYIGPFVILMGTLVFIHELGHFLVAKYFGVRVEVFSLGFGKSLYEFTRGDTTYKLALIPLGGYVKMYGDDPSGEVPEDQKQYSFLHKPVSQRIWIVLAGPLMNFFVAIPIFAMILIVGYKAPSSQLGDIKESTEAYKIGFRSGDVITHVNNSKVKSWTEIEKTISDNSQKDVSFTISRKNEASKVLTANIPQVENEKVFSMSKYMGKIEGLSILNKQSLIGVRNQSIAFESGLKSLDKILEINGDKVSYWREIEPLLIKHKNSTLNLKVQQFSQTETLPIRDVTLKSSYSINGQSIMDSLGIENTSNYILAVVKDSPAERSGLKAGDKIISINSNTTPTWENILSNISSYKAGDKNITLVVENSNPEYERHVTAKTISLKPEMSEFMNRQNMKEENRFTVGIYPEATYATAAPITIKSSNPIAALKYGFKETINWTKLMAISFYKLATNKVSTRNIAGVVTIGKVAGDSFKAGIDLFLKMMGLISVNLFILNLLPIPVLDGGHLVFFTIEAIKGSPLSLKKMQAAQQFGFVILLSLMIFSFYNDIRNLINPLW